MNWTVQFIYFVFCGVKLESELNGLLQNAAKE